jgi:cytochrome P450
MSSVYLTVQASLLCIFLWVLWRALKQIVVKHPLDDIPGPPPQSYLWGNFKQIFNPQSWAFHQSLVDQYGGVAKIYGTFADIQLYVSDSKALHHILVKDQSIFEETNWFIQSNRMMFGMGLFATLGEHHKKQRKMLNPVFSTNHLRDMLPIFYEISYKVLQLRLFLSRRYKSSLLN